jgi:hypothetical protein
LWEHRSCSQIRAKRGGVRSIGAVYNRARRDAIKYPLADAMSREN